MQIKKPKKTQAGFRMSLALFRSESGILPDMKKDDLRIRFQSSQAGDVLKIELKE